MKRSFFKTGAAVLCAALALTTFGSTADVLAYSGNNDRVVVTTNTVPAPYDNTLTLEENNIDFMEIVRYFNYVTKHRRDYDDVTYWEIVRDVQSYYIEFLSQQGLITSEEDMNTVLAFARDLRNEEYDYNLTFDQNYRNIYMAADEVYLTYFRDWDGL